MKRIEHQNIDGVECKRCGKCKQWKPLECFSRNKTVWDGKCRVCKDCAKTRIVYKDVERRTVFCACGCKQEIITPDRYGREREFKKGHHPRVQRKGVYSDHLRESNERKKKKYTFVDGVEGKECGRCKEWKPLEEYGPSKDSPDNLENRCKECMREKGLRYYHKHAKEIAKKRATPEYRERFNAYCREYDKRRCATDVNYRLKRRLRSSLRSAIKRNTKSGHTVDLLGCTIEELKQYLESQFQGGMNWNNWGQPGWEIDHIIPCAAFDFSIPEHQERCFHYTNLQPLWGPDNWAKSDTMPEGIMI